MWCLMIYKRDEWEVSTFYKYTEEVYQNHELYDTDLNKMKYIEMYDGRYSKIVFNMNANYDGVFLEAHRSHRPGKREFSLNQLISQARSAIRELALDRILLDNDPKAD